MQKATSKPKVIKVPKASKCISTSTNYDVPTVHPTLNNDEIDFFMNAPQKVVEGKIEFC